MYTTFELYFVVSPQTEYGETPILHLTLCVVRTFIHICMVPAKCP